MLNPDDNILMRANIYSKKENSLSIATKHIPKTELADQKLAFEREMERRKRQIDNMEKEIQKRKSKDFREVGNNH